MLVIPQRIGIVQSIVLFGLPALLLWATLVGGTSLEVFGQYGRDTLTAPGALLEHQLRLALAVLRAA